MRREKRISTRAPTRGATLAKHGEPDALQRISTRAPTRGATALIRRIVSRRSFLLAPLREGRRVPPCPVTRRINYFYSRPYARGDPRVGEFDC